MPEIKHTFTTGKMNKDADERIVPNGEYRDALNIQVRTTDGDSNGLGDAGAIQNIKGNKRTDAGAYSIVDYNNENRTRIIGSIADEAKDRAFFFAAAPLPYDGIHDVSPDMILSASLNDDGDTVPGQSLKVWIDSIFELSYSDVGYGGSNEDSIITDLFMITGTYADIVGANTSASVDYAYITVPISIPCRADMILRAWDSSGVDLLTSSVTIPDGDGEEIQQQAGVEVINVVAVDLSGDGTNDAYQVVLAEKQTSNLLVSCATMKFYSKERVLEFDYYKKVDNTLQRVKNNLTAINIIDDLLFWSDGVHEPKKINIERCRIGSSDTPSDPLSPHAHTKLFITHPVDGDLLEMIDEDLLMDAGDVDKVYSHIKREHITVIRKAPTTAPVLKLSISDRQGDTTFEVDYPFADDTTPTDGTIINDIIFPDGVDCRVDDIFRFTAQNIFFTEPAIVTLKIIGIDGTTVTGRILFVTDSVVDNNPLDWEVRLEQRKPLFEDKFGRFGYRYKYDDGEYSSFSPWSELAFLPGDFEYTPSKGYNKAMSSNVRSLIIKGFIPSDVGPTAPIVTIQPNDVKEVDILWKTSDNQNVYVVKTVTRVKDLEWTADETGSMTVTSEMIHKVLPANQTLRGWDNVPRKAIAQEMTANRLIFGNYVQGYDIKQAFGLKQSIKSTHVQFPNPRKSVKTSRNYKFGAVFGDEYGRETPVIAGGYKNTNYNGGDGVEENITGDIDVEKSLAGYSNKFQLEQSWDSTMGPPEWMKYIKYFVKETSNEYYNLIMDRWYDAEDGNVWIAFPSVDRNKIDEETFLLLKNTHGSQRTVTEEARYKVIAIENDAPDYIKTVNNDHDLIVIPRDTVYGTTNNVNDGVPDGLINVRKLELGSDDWGDIDTKDFKGIAKARIVGRFNSSNDGWVQAEGPWRNLSKIHNPDEGEKGVTFREPFEEVDVNMYQKLIYKLTDPSELTNFTDDVDGHAEDDSGYEIIYHVQLRDAVVENKPQFDGRFFVKLEKDTTLEATVLGNQVSYEVQNVFEVAYIASRKDHRAQDSAVHPGEYAGKTWGEYTDGGANIFTEAEIQWDDTWNTLSNLSDPENFGAVPAGNISVETINEDANGTHEVYGDEKNQTVPLFGPGDYSDDNKTEQFWEWWWSEGAVSFPEADIDGDGDLRKTNIFIDEARAYSGFSILGSLQDEVNDTTVYRQLYGAFTGQGNPISHLIDNGIYGPYPQGATYPYPPYSFEQNENQNWLPTGMQRGSQSDGGPGTNHLGQFAFSVIKDDWNANTHDALFKAAMTSPNTVFRFQSDPTNTHYKIVNFALSTGWVDGYEDFGDTSGYKEIESKNFASDDNDLRKRYTIITRFCKLDDNNNPIFDEGLDPMVWDPRGEVRHDGVGSLKIEVLTQIGNFDLSDSSLATNAGCWETEPKEDVGLDIYYEASEGIPINLENKKDLINYTKPSGDRKKASNLEFYRDHKKVDVNGSIPYLSRVLSNDAIEARYQTWDFLDGEIVPGYILPLTGTIAIGDIVNFVHSSNPYGSGIITKSKIIDHYDTFTAPGTTDIPVLSPRRTLGVTHNTTVIAGVTWNILYPVPSTIDGVSIIGTQVVGDCVDSPIFVVDYYTDTAVLSGKVNADCSFLYGSYTFIISTGWFKIDTNVWNYPIELGWFNCYSFGNGVESDRIRDDFNAPQIDNGIKVSSTFLGYGEENLGSGLIYSNLYNSTSSVNDLNEFNMAEKITKNLNPIYGSIQALKTAERNLTVFTEDKVLKVLANKDAVYNADGNPQLTATNKVLGDATPYSGDYGISKNPESLASDQYRMYFTDRQRGAVLRLSNDGLTPISDVGMKTYFRERLRKSDSILGTFDKVSGEYNLTMNTGWAYNASLDPAVTVSFNEQSKGWVSFKSFIPSTGVSVSGKYLTASDQEDLADENLKNFGAIWEHYDDDASRNNFYAKQYRSEVEVMFNDQPDVVKSFKTMNYEGSQSKVIQNLQDNDYYNLTAKNGWWVESFTTDLQTGHIREFIDKENKWFNKIEGESTTLSNLDTNEFSVQGIGTPVIVISTPPDDASLWIQDFNDDDEE